MSEHTAYTREGSAALVRPVLAGTGLRRTFGSGATQVHALDGVDIEVPAGRLTVVRGPSGSGKTTLLNLLGGLDRPTSGRVLLMAYIGGLGFFIGPIIGAIVLTLITSVLSNYTELWMLYLGLLFVLTVMFLPRGLTGFLMMHRMAWHLGRLKTLALPYTLTAIPGALLFLIIVSMLEMLHAHSEAFLFLGLLELNPSGIGSWAFLIILAAATFYVLRLTLPRLRSAWSHANTPPGRLDQSPPATPPAPGAVTPAVEGGDR